MTRLLHLWCKLAHRDISLPFNGEYQCWTCGRRHRVNWPVSARVRAQWDEQDRKVRLEPAASER